MKHNIRQRVLDPVTGLTLTKIEAVTGELGSGIVDKNGREIFEGDRVRVISPSEGTFVGTVRFEDGSFSIYSPRIDSPDGTYTVEPERDYLVSGCYSHNFIIVGHVEETNYEA